ncbi:MAG TPA: fatty acid desaturase [Bryobacteraceae bacterium]|nr:fatty acid desaturase [Bryobacteraceae bacterium]
MHLLVIATVTVVILQMSVFFTTIYLHRCITHRGLSLHPVIGNLMHLHLSLFTGLIPREWAAVHRKHHHFSDKEGDPHSPYLLGLWHVLLGNYFYYKREANNAATVRKYTPDYQGDLIDRIPLIQYGLFGGLLIFMALFGWKWGIAAWLFHIVGYVLLNSSINSLCHMIGYRNFNNKATNLQSIAFVTGGEGLHNNHHAFPSSARFALRGREIDPAWLVIRLLESVGLAEVKPEPLAKAA